MESSVFYRRLSLLVVGAAVVLMQACGGGEEQAAETAEVQVAAVWQAPDTSSWQTDVDAALLRYGRELVANTSAYFGPQGSLAAATNGLNCQNCHLDAGTRSFSNNYALVASGYPRFRARSGTLETLHKRIADCFQRSLNGTAPDSNSLEAAAIKAYVLWVGKDVEAGTKPHGAGLATIPFLERAGDPVQGEQLYVAKCVSCHQADGQGLPNGMGGYAFPPLWGPNSYNAAAGLHRMSRFASYVKQSMPLGASHEAPLLSDEEAWDLAAYVNSQPRPAFDLSADWPDISLKPVDHPFGPFSDTFPEQQHKYGPFGPIKAAREQSKPKA